MPLEDVNEAIGYFSAALGVFDKGASRVTPLFSDVSKYSPVRAGITATSFVITAKDFVNNPASRSFKDVARTGADVALTISTYAPKVLPKVAARIVPGLGSALLAYDVCTIVGKPMLQRIEARADTGCEQSKKALKGLDQAKNSLGIATASVGQFMDHAESRFKSLSNLL